MNSQNTYQIIGNEYWFRFTATTNANAAASCEFTINTNNIGIDAKIEFFDIVGKKIKEINLNSESNIKTISISGLRNGIYFIKISNKNTYIDTFKIIKLQ